MNLKIISLSVAIIVVGGGVAWWMRSPAPAGEKKSKRVKLHADTEQQLGPMVGLIPGDDWWGKAKGFLVVLNLGEDGKAAIATESGDLVLDAQLRMPDIDLLLYVMSNEEHSSEWFAHMPEIEIPPEKIDTEEDVIAEIVVDRIAGTFMPGENRFSLFRWVIRDPAKTLDAQDVATLKRLRRLLEK